MANSCTEKRSPLFEEEISDDVELEKFDYIRFTFADINGVSRSKTIPKEHAREFLKKGITMFVGSIAFGPRAEVFPIKEIKETKISNAFVRPMAGTFHSLPWASSDGKVKMGEFLCETFWIKPYRDGGHQAACPRFMARQQLDRLFNLGYELYSTFEAEFCIFEKDLTTPLFSGIDIISSLLMDRHGTHLYEMERRLRESGVDIIALHSEYGPGQFEAALQPNYGIHGADQMFRFKDGVKAMTYHNGQVATFMAKPDSSVSTSGLHFNHSLWSTNSKTNAFYDAQDKDGLSDVAKHWIAGLTKHARALTALCCPTLSCYHRLHTTFAPSKANWSIGGRFFAYRVKNLDAYETYVESRLPSSAANPYLAMAGTLAAGIDGIINKLECPAEGDTLGASPLAKSLEESLKFLEEDEVMVAALGEEFIRWFTTMKREHEVNPTKDLDPEKAFEKEKQLYFEFI